MERNVAKAVFEN